MKFQPNRLAGYSEADIIQEIRRVVLEECKGVVPSLREFARVARIHPRTITTKFGGYRQAIRQAGFEYAEKYAAEQVKANLLEVLKRANGHWFNRDFYQKHGGRYSVKTVKSILGLSWGAALESIGAQKRVKIHVQHISAYAQRRKALANLTDDELFKEMDRIWKKIGRRPTSPEFRQLASIRDGIYQTRFGSWTKAIEAFCKATGVRVQGKGGTLVTKEILLDELRRVAAIAPRVSLTYHVYKTNGGTFSRKPFKSHFGSWTKAVNAAGGLSGRQQKYSNDELFDEIQRLWEQFGRQPTGLEMQQSGKISTYTYALRFGSWTKAVYAFCEDRNSDSALTPPPAPEPPIAFQAPTEPDKKEPPVASPSAESAPQFIVHHRTARSVPKRLRWRVFARDNFTCRGCGRSPAKHGVVLEADHVVAWTNGGETVLENLQTLCEVCNSGKSNL